MKNFLNDAIHLRAQSAQFSCGEVYKIYSFKYYTYIVYLKFMPGKATAFGLLMLVASLSVLVASAGLFYFTQPEILKSNAVSSVQKMYQAEPPPDKIENLMEECSGKQFIERKSMSGHSFKFYCDKIMASTQQSIGAYFGSELFSQGYSRNFPAEKASVFELAMSQFGNTIFAQTALFSFLFFIAGIVILCMNKKKGFEISKYLGISLILSSLPIIALPILGYFLNLPDSAGAYTSALQNFLSPLFSVFAFSSSAAISVGIALMLAAVYFEKKNIAQLKTMDSAEPKNRKDLSANQNF